MGSNPTGGLVLVLVLVVLVLLGLVLVVLLLVLVLLAVLVALVFKSFHSKPFGHIEDLTHGLPHAERV